MVSKILCGLADHSCGVHIIIESIHVGIQQLSDLSPQYSRNIYPRILQYSCHYHLRAHL